MFNVEDIIERERAAMGGLGPFERRWLIEHRSPEHVKRVLRLAEQRRGLYGMPSSPYQGPESQPVCNPASFTAVTASATETNLWQAPGTWTPIGANVLRPGVAYEIKCGGVFTTTGTQGTLTWTARAGQSATPASNVSLGASNAVAWAASLTAAPWYAEFTMVCRSLGVAASGATCTGNGMAYTQGAAAATGTVYVFGGTVAATVDNTAAIGIVLSVTISVASQSITCQWVTPVRSYQ